MSKLVEQREKLNLTQEELSKKSGISVSLNWIESAESCKFAIISEIVEN